MTPRWQALAWLTTVAVHEAWRLNRIHRRDGPFDPEKIDTLSMHRQRADQPHTTSPPNS
jgi:hypothetical protein